MSDNITTAWMWQEGVYTRGINLNIEQQRLEWQEDLVGFGCSLMPRYQSTTDFLDNGAKRYASPPDDILAEIRESIELSRETS